MRRQIIDILTIIILLIGAFFLYTYFFGTPKMMEQWTFHRLDKPPESYEDKRKNAQEEAKKDAENYNNALKNQDIRLCNAILNTREQGRCRDIISATEALKEKNQEKCKTLSDTGIAERCQDNIVLAGAEETQDRSKCADVLDDALRLECVEAIDTKILSTRLASGSVDDAFCQTLSESLQKQCQSHIVRKNDSIIYQNTIVSKKLSDCEKIVDTDMQRQCHDSIILERAFHDNDAKACQSLINPEKVKYCQNTFNTKNEMTLYQSIVSGGDITTCKDLKSDSLQSQCHDTLIITKVRNTRDSLLCQSLYNTGSIKSCESLIPVP